MKKLAILVVGLMLVAAACNKNQPNDNPGTVIKDPANKPDTSMGTTAPPLETPAPEAPTTATINMTSAGFQPANITVKKGTTVTFVNKDTQPHWPASGPHPTHTALPGFDALKAIPSGGSYSYTFTKVGVWSYHDHLNSSLFGKITVTE